MTKFGRVSHLEMAHSAYLSLCDFYAGFVCPDLKNGCDPIENVPSWFDWVWYFVWYSVDVYVSLDDPISFTFYPEICVNLHIKIPTNLGPGYTSEISRLKA